jgi:hypothetical protein
VVSEDAQTFTCVVCGDEVSAALSAECHWCDGRYHLNTRNDIAAKDCGRVWIDEQYMALRFACDNCLAGQRRAPRERPTRVRARTRRYRRRA